MMTESSSSPHTDTLDDRKTDLLARFQAQTGSEDVQHSIRTLDENNWNLDAAVRSFNSPNPRTNQSGWFSTFWNVGYNFFASFLPGQEVDPVIASARFLTEFELQYGDVHPTFFRGSFQQACNRSKSDFKFLIAYLHSPMHQNTNQFCKDTLCTSLITDFFNENFIFWAGSISNSEAYKASLLLGASSYPFMAVLCHNNVGGITICDRIEDLISSEDLMVRLTTVLEQFGANLLQQRLDSEERDQNRRIREEQDAAYQQSLMEDEAKQMRQQQEEESRRAEQDAIQQEELRRQRKVEEKQRQKESIRRTLPPEPDQGEGIANLVIRMIDGSRLQRRFYKTDTLQVVFNYIDSNISEDLSYDLVSNFPRKIFTDRSVTLEQAGLFPHASIFVQERL